MLLNCGVGEDSWESPLDSRRSNQSIIKEISPEYSWGNWCWSWNSNTLATWCEELTHWKRPWCWERSKAGGERDDRGWDGWMASLIRWTWVWADSRSWWWTGRPGTLQSMGSQRVGHDWATELNWTDMETNENDSTTIPNQWDTVKTILRGKFIVTQVYLTSGNRKISNKQPNLTSKGTRKIIDGSPPGSTVPGILQARVLEWVAIAFATDKPRQRIKEQRHYFADKGPYSQSYGFSSSYVQMLRAGS